MIMQQNKHQFQTGMRDGIPISLGYFAVSFTFGIAAQGILTPFQAATMAATNFASAGQFSALESIRSAAPYIELAMAQFIINLRYCLMSCALSQKLDVNTSLLHRLLLACGITDELFGISACRTGNLSPFYTYGAMCVAMPGWVLGTAFGSVLGSIMPARVLSALGIALYAMFIAVIIPPAKNNRVLVGVIIASMLASFLCDALPFIQLSGGFKVIVITILIAGLAAILFPLETKDASTDTESAVYGGTQ